MQIDSKAAALALGQLADASAKLEAALLNYEDARQNARTWLPLQGIDVPQAPQPPPTPPPPPVVAIDARRVSRAALSARGKRPRAA